MRGLKSQGKDIELVLKLLVIMYLWSILLIVLLDPQEKIKFWSCFLVVSYTAVNLCCHATLLPTSKVERSERCMMSHNKVLQRRETSFWGQAFGVCLYDLTPPWDIKLMRASTVNYACYFVKTQVFTVYSVCILYVIGC